MIKEIYNEVIDVIEESFETIMKKDYVSYILYIGRADMIPGLRTHVGTDCVVDYKLDRYYDKTREAFYLHYLGRNYSREGFHYEGESGIDDLSVEMMIYCHLWDSSYFLKSLYRLAAILDDKGYQWNPNVPENGKYNFIKNNIISPLQAKNIHLGNLVAKAFDSNIRNAFAHSLYDVDVEAREIYTRTKQGNRTYTFDEFQNIFLYSVILMNKLQYYLEMNHDDAGTKNNALTNAFFTPDGLKVQVYGQMINRAGKLYPEFRLVKIKEIEDN
jgi:hypothetical protein